MTKKDITATYFPTKLTKFTNYNIKMLEVSAVNDLIF